METAALCKPIQRFADLLRIPDTWVLTGLGKLLAALGSFPHFPQPLRLLHTHLYWRFLECQSIEVTLTQNGHLTHHEIPSVASLRPGGHFPRIGWPVSPEYAVKLHITPYGSPKIALPDHRSAPSFITVKARSLERIKLLSKKWFVTPRVKVPLASRLLDGSKGVASKASFRFHGYAKVTSAGEDLEGSVCYRRLCRRQALHSHIHHMGPQDCLLESV